MHARRSPASLLKAQILSLWPDSLLLLIVYRRLAAFCR